VSHSRSTIRFAAAAGLVLAVLAPPAAAEVRRVELDVNGYLCGL